MDPHHYVGNVQLDSQLIDVMCPTFILGQRSIGIEESMKLAVFMTVLAFFTFH